MRVDDVEPLAAHDAARAARSAPGVKANPDPGASGARMRCTGMPSTIVVAARRRHDARVDVRRAQRQREVAQMELDPALAREEPVADEGDAHEPRR